MNTTKSEVEEFLRQAREIIALKKVVLVPRNLDWLRDLEITESQAWAIIAGLTVNNCHVLGGLLLTWRRVGK